MAILQEREHYPHQPDLGGNSKIACMLSHFNCVLLFVTLWTVACHTPLSMGFSRQEYLSGLPFPPPGDLPVPGIKPHLLHWLTDSLALSHLGSPIESHIAQSCPTLCNPMDCRPTGFSIHGILQAGILKWVAMPSSRGSSCLRIRTPICYISCIGRRLFTIQATWEAHLVFKETQK